MAELADGNKKLLYVRRKGDVDQARKPLFQTEHSSSLTRDREGTPTKDGSISSTAPLEDETSLTILRPAEDTEVYDLLELAVRDGFAMEFWEVDIEKAGQTTGGEEGYFARYRQGYITEWESTEGSEDAPETEITYLANGVFRYGYTKADPRDVAAAGYVFHELDSQGADNATEAEQTAAAKTWDEIIAEDAGTDTSGGTTEGTTEGTTDDGSTEPTV